MLTMDIFNSPVAKRTRLQCQLLAQGCGSSSSSEGTLGLSKRVKESFLESDEETSTDNGSESSSRSTRRRLECKTVDQESSVEQSEEETSHENGSDGTSCGQEVHEVIDVDNYSIDQSSSRKSKPNGSEGSSRSVRRRLNEVNLVGDSSVEQSEEEKSSESASESSSVSRRRDDEAKLIDELSVDESKEETNGSGGLSRSNGESSVAGSEEEGSDDEESHHSLKESDADKEINNTESANIAMKKQGSPSFFKTEPHTYFISDDSDSDDSVVDFDEEEDVEEDIPIFFREIQDQSTEDESICSSESESDRSDNFVFLPLNTKKLTEKDIRETVWSGSIDGKGKNPSVHKTNIKKENLKPTSCSTGIHTHEKRNAKHKASERYTTVKKEIFVKNQKTSTHRRVQRKDDGAYVDSLLNPIIDNKDGHHKEDENENFLPLKFRFDDSEDESSSQKTGESDIEELFIKMNFALDCEDIGSYKPSTVENQEKDPFKLCQRGEHTDIYLDEQIGLRCGLCGAVIQEIRNVISKEANYALDRSKRSYHFNEQEFYSSKNMHFEASDSNPQDNYKQTEGTVLELIPTTIQAHLLSHQQEGFKFLWKNLAGTIELSKLPELDQLRGGGCIISHAPGTGKSLLAIVFLKSFLKRFPNCCPVIVAPASILLTWEDEFKKWQVGVSFVNLNSSEFSGKEVNGKFKPKKDEIRARRINCWSKGGSVLGVSYNLYGKLAGDTKNKNLEKMGKVLLDKPGLVILDEGHTPRNQRSKIWNALKRLKTKRRGILSGTPFQNNFKELFNMLHLVRPRIWTKMMNNKMFAEMVQPIKRKNSRSGSEKQIEELKVIMSPFVHVHNGKILEKLPGLKRSVIFLNLLPLQELLIQKLGNLAPLEYDHRVALVSVHPSLILKCPSEKEKQKDSMTKELEKVRLQPEFGVKTRFVMELIRLSISLNEKVLIFSQYIEPVKLLKEQITNVFGWKYEREIMSIEGRTHQKQRQMIINDFNDANSEVKVLLASIRCCSEGIHLIGASRVVLLDVVWNHSVEKQATSRAYRLGQKKVVYTYRLMGYGTTEEKKSDRQDEKARLGELVFSSSVMAGEEVKKDEKVNTTKLNDKILQQLVDHQELKNMFKEIRYPEEQTTI